MKLLIVDDHPVLREGLAALLRQTGPDTSIVLAESAPTALALLDRHLDLDIVVLDLMMPGMNGMAAITEFGRKRPDLPVIVLSSSEDPHEARRALALGALGYVPKSAGQHTLIAAIDLVMKGEVYIPPLILGESTKRPGSYQAAGGGGSPLTERQVEVLRRLSAGQPNKTIAYELDLSEKTVKAHITAIFKALNVVNRTQAAAAGRDLGLV
ncbi:response regulator [Mesorhizobium sp. IMUNJ 23232]|uniref:response regulator n=1 Tax=Mesorhizobium sp. IMUNJ 23232 TaxID=3376064 RepID=UPI00379A8EF8